MNGKTIGGIIVLALGVVIVAILCGLGGYAKQAVHDGVTSRLEYELPKGYEKDPNFEQCYKSITTPAFDEEYYLWDMTNLPEVLNGAKPNFNLVGMLFLFSFILVQGHFLFFLFFFLFVFLAVFLSFMSFLFHLFYLLCVTCAYRSFLIH